MQNDSKDTSHLAVNGFGETLRQARTQKNLTLEEVAKETFILKRHLQALEEENFEALPQAAFAKGFASNYAKYLGLDATTISQQFDANYPAHLKPKSSADIRSPLQPMGTLQRDSRGSIKINWLFIAGLLLALVVVGMFIYKTVIKANTDNQTPATTTTTQSMNPQDQAKGAALGNTGSAISGVTSSPATLGNAGSALPSAGSAINNTAAANPEANNSLSHLEFWVQAPTGVTVTDATGKTLLQGEQHKGSYKIAGQPPFNISIDNIKTVSLDMNKQPIKLSDYIPANQSQTTQASFTLKP